MSKRLFTATVGIALGVLATTADARPNQGQHGYRQSDQSYSSDDGERAARSTRGQRRQATRHTRQRQATQGGQRRSTARRGSSRHAGGGASRGCLTPATRGLLGRIESRFGSVQIISTCRPGARVALSGRPSKHASGQAIDFNAGSRKGAVVRWLIANHKSGGIMTYSGMSHIHVDIGQHFVSLGARGRG